MSALTDARAHLAKAKEFLTAAERDLEIELFNVATSNAVISGINSKDAICLALTGTTGKFENHSAAVGELRAAGVNQGAHAGSTKQLATILGRLLKLKNKSQYQTSDVVRSAATKAVDWAQKMLDGASDIGAG